MTGCDACGVNQKPEMIEKVKHRDHYHNVCKICVDIVKDDPDTYLKDED